MFVLLEMSYFFDLEKSGTLGVPKRVLHDTGTEPLETYKTGTDRTPVLDVLYNLKSYHYSSHS
jgi:acyl-coenzyme A synthetase/AMP-(fatty) acid ligase